MDRSRCSEGPLVLQQQKRPVPLPDIKFLETIQQGPRSPISQKLDVSKVGGRLQYFLKSWQSITNDAFVLQCIKGYKISFKGKVFQTRVPEKKFSNPQELEACKIEINKLLKKGAIRPCRPEPGQFISSYFLAPKRNGTYRFIFNLRKLNEFIETRHFKLEDIRTAKNLVTKNCFMATIDLEDAYYTVPIHPSCTKYLRFIFQGILYEFVVVPFGLDVAPLLFTKIMKPVVSFQRRRGFSSVIYLDDKLVLGQTYQKCLQNVQETIKLLESLGFIVNREKSVLEPTQCCKFLGFVLNSVSLILENTEDRKKNTLTLLAKMREKEHCTIEEFASLIGKLVSLCPATTYGRLYTKVLERKKFLALRDSEFDFKQDMIISQVAKEDMKWWQDNLDKETASLHEPDYDVTIFTDASRSGWGAKMGQK